MNFAELARQLGRRGHRITVFQSADLEPTISIRELDFIPLHRVVSNGNTTRTDSAGGKRSAVHRFLDYTISNARMFCEQAPAAFKTACVDGVVVDVYEPGGATAAEAAGLPYVTLCSAVPLHSEPGVPPDFLDWRYHDAWWARLRNRFAYSVRDLRIRPLYRALNQYRRRWSLPPYHHPDDSFSSVAQISQLVAEFDFPRKRLPACFHYVGPYRRECEEDVEFPYERLNGKPVVYASLGTVLGSRKDVWDAIVQGCTGLDIQLVISLGNPGSWDHSSDIASDMIVVDYAPQRKLLGRASLAITHAGLNSVMEALAARVPLLAIPITGDQFSVGSRIVCSGTGEVLRADGCDSAAISIAVRRILSRDTYRQRASLIADAIERTRGAAYAAEIVEQAVCTGKPVLRS